MNREEEGARTERRALFREPERPSIGGYVEEDDIPGGCRRRRREEEEEEGGEQRVWGRRALGVRLLEPISPPLLPAVRRKGELRMEETMVEVVGRFLFRFRFFLPRGRKNPQGRFTPACCHCRRNVFSLTASVSLSYRPKCFLDSHIGRLQQEDLGVLLKIDDVYDAPRGLAKKEA